MTTDRNHKGGGAPTRLDLVIVIAMLLCITALAWTYTVYQANLMNEMEAAMWRDMNMSMNGMEQPWTPLHALLLFVMWTAMMAAMMVPSTSPMVAAFTSISPEA
jgi:predicted metal-binding membrane protein